MMRILNLFRKREISGAARTLSAEAKRQHRDRVWAKVNELRREMGEPPLGRVR